MEEKIWKILESYGMNPMLQPNCSLEIIGLFKCCDCGKNNTEICGKYLSDIAQSTADQAYNSR